MKVSTWQFFKYFYVIIIIIWILLSIHIFYLYIDFSSKKIPVKWWTFVEATFNNINYLPYTSEDQNDRFYQSFLFRWCLTPYVDNTNVEFADEVCHVNSLDSQTYKVKIMDNVYWSDWEPISIEDVYFTYNNILKENIWELPWMDSYKNTEMSYTGNTMTVKFPKPSIDNKIFFTNYILPKHLLEWKNLNEYIDIYRNNLNPVFNNCAQLQTTSKDINSIVFDLTNCTKSYIKFYQVKNFDNFEKFRNYINDWKNNIVDTYVHNETLSWFKENKVILWQFISLFFNTESNILTLDTRKALSSVIINNIYTWTYERTFVRDNFIFNEELSWWNLKELIEKQLNDLKKPKIIEDSILSLTWYAILSWWLTNEYYLEWFNETYPFKFQFTKWWYQKISISHNDAPEYFLKWYKSWNQSGLYNISIKYKNINEGKNSYTIKWYNNWKLSDTYNIVLYYKQKPVKEIIHQEIYPQIQIIYHKDENSTFVANELQKIFSWLNIIDKFEIVWFDSLDEFEWKIQWKDYDIVIRWIDLWLRKDISWIFRSDNPSVNPSKYINPEFADNIWTYLYSSSSSTRIKTKENIDKTYLKNIPLIILWKTYWKLNIRENLSYSYPLRLYDYIFRKDQLWNIILVYKPQLDINKLFDFNNFVDFMNFWLLNDLNDWTISKNLENTNIENVF